MKSVPNLNAAAIRRLRAAMMEAQGGVCPLCTFSMSLNAARDSLLYPTLDHIVPRCRGGSHEVDNLQLVHHLCNQRKGSSDPRADHQRAPEPVRRFA